MKRVFICCFLVLVLQVKCNRAPADEILIVKQTLDSAIQEKLNVNGPIEFYLIQDSIYIVLEEIERKKSSLYPYRYTSEIQLLKKLTLKLNILRNSKRTKDDILENNCAEDDSLYKNKLLTN